MPVYAVISKLANRPEGFAEATKLIALALADLGETKFAMGSAKGDVFTVLLETDVDARHVENHIQSPRLRPSGVGIDDTVLVLAVTDFCVRNNLIAAWIKTHLSRPSGREK